MRYAIYTLSGARYMIDLRNMRWRREGAKSNQEVILGLGETEGTLYSKPHIEIGKRAMIQVGPSDSDYILCTAIQRIELLEDESE